VIILICSCQKRRLSPSDYVSFITDSKNELNIRKNVGKYIVRSQYEPVDYLALLEIGKSANSISRSEFESVKRRFEKLSCFTFSISDTNSGGDLIRSMLKDTLEKRQLTNYLNFEMQKDLLLIQGSDTSACVLFHYEHSYGISSENRFVLGFENKNEGLDIISNMKLLFKGQMLDLGTVIFEYKKEYLEKIPLVLI